MLDQYADLVVEDPIAADGDQGRVLDQDRGAADMATGFDGDPLDADIGGALDMDRRIHPQGVPIRSGGLHRQDGARFALKGERLVDGDRLRLDVLSGLKNDRATRLYARDGGGELILAWLKHDPRARRTFRRVSILPGAREGHACGEPADQHRKDCQYRQPATPTELQGVSPSPDVALPFPASRQPGRKPMTAAGTIQ